MKVITSHMNADFDSLASMVAARKLYPDALMSFPGSQEESVRRFIREEMGPALEFTRLKDIDLKQVDTLILVDTRQKERIGDFASCLDNPGLRIHIFDHHPDQSHYLHGQQEIIEPLGSTATIFCKLFQKQNMAVSPAEATLFALGIYADTGSFTHQTTTVEDLEQTAWLLGKGVNLDTVSRYLVTSLTGRQVNLIHDLTRNAKNYIISNTNVVIASLTLPEYESDFAMIVKQVMSMENLNTLFALVCMEGRIYLIARSRIASVNCGDIAKDFGGGGHDSAAAATIRDMSMIEAHEKLVRSLHRHVLPRAVAGEMLSSPVISIPERTTIKEANDLLTRYNITVLPVVAPDNTEQKHTAGILGTISRRVTEKAIHHNLGSAMVRDYMTTDIEILPLSATLADIEEIIIERRQRLVPVVHDRKFVGVITRTDLLQMLLGDPGHNPSDLVEGDAPPGKKQRNVQPLLREVLDKDFIALLRLIGEKAQESGYKAYAVGGFVRDLLLKQKNLDLDIVIEGNGIIFAKKLVETTGGKVRTHDRFLTANIILPDGFKIDIATARLEYYEYPAAMPTVELSSIKLDLYRRDFSINAMALALNPTRFGTIIDFFNCQNDLKDKLIKVLHNLSFVEDPSRILRAVRFEQRLNFSIARHTERLIKNAVDAGLFGQQNNPRLFTELQQILLEENPAPAIKRLSDLNIVQYLWPDLKPNLKIDRRFLHILTQARRAISWFRLLYLEENAELEPWRIYLLAVMARSRPEQLESFCERFEIPAKTTLDLIRDKRDIDRLADKWYRKMPEQNSMVRNELEPFSNDAILYLMTIAKKSDIQKKVSLYVTTMRTVQPLLTGTDLIEMGLLPGEIFREILASVRDAQLDGRISSREDARTFVAAMEHGCSSNETSGSAIPPP